MRIALAIEHFSPDQGGAERYAWGLARWLAAQGHALDVYAARASPDAGFVRAVHRLAVPAGAARLAGWAAALQQALAGRTYDVVHGFNHARPCDLLRLGGGVHLAFEAWSARSGRGALDRRLKALAYRLLPRYRAVRDNERRQFDDPARRFMAVSQRVADDMAAFYPACRGRIHVIPNGVDAAVFNPEAVARRRADARARLGLGAEDVALLFVSNNYRLKGLRDLIAAWPRAAGSGAMPPLLLVAGRGRPGPYLRQARRAGCAGSLRFLASTPDPLELYAAADGLVHPTYYDACSNVTLEALACGLPVLTSTNNGAAELMRDAAGVVALDVPAPAEALAAAIRRIADPEMRRAALESNPARARQLPLEANYRAVAQLYETIARERGG